MFSCLCDLDENVQKKKEKFCWLYLKQYGDHDVV